ncbi:MAG TPA: diguanylate cyclase [Thermoanaerobaculia bacterium]|jgi:diguanylate cyclase (GGDEF)-like protein|nr:diguanylate cyclase [Thermoanaerobaculia bacterium]
MGQPTIILLEDDTNVSLALSLQLGRRGYHVLTAASIAAARELFRDPWDLAILDRNLPDGDGVDLCRELRGTAPHAYIVMHTGADSQEAKLEGFACGADDYISKSANTDEFMARIRAGLRIVALQKQLLELSQTDPLTSLRNRRAFDERIGETFEHARRYDRPLSLAIVDVDHFKSINDTHGHDVGDAVLRRIAKIMALVTRQTDFVARIGGEEFAILLPETALFEALQFGEKIRSAIAAEPVEGHELRVSIGIASFPHSDVPGEAELFRAADQALYRAKMNGRNRVEIERRRHCRPAPSAPHRISAAV